MQTSIRRVLTAARVTLLSGWFWKAILLVLLAMFGLVVVAADPGEFGVPKFLSTDQVPHWSAKAPLFALISAGMLFALAIPKNNTGLDEAAETLGQVLLALATLGAGVYWLLDDTVGHPGGVLWGVVLGIVAIGFLAIVAGVVSRVVRIKKANVSQTPEA